MSKVWLIADTHFNHENMIAYENRPFSSKEEMNEKIIENWNNVVMPDDVVYHLGDVVFGGRNLRDAVLPRLNGYKILRMGNHDRRTKKNTLKKYFDEVYDEDILLDGLFCLSHYPLDEETSTKLINNGLIKGNVHGHVHSKIDGLDQEKYMCVSVDLHAYTPVPLEKVKEHFNVSLSDNGIFGRFEAKED